MSLEISGDKAVRDRFEALPRKVRNKLLRKGMIAAARVVRNKAREDAPYDEGDLKKSGKVRGLQRAKKQGFQRVMGGGGIPDVGKEVAFTAPHAHLIEKGRKGVEPVPFLENALEAKNTEVRQIIADSVIEGMKEA